WSAPINSVDSTTITAIPATTGHQALIQNFAPLGLFDMIIGGLAGDDHIVYVALAESSARNANELRFLLQILNGAATEVAHAGTKAANQLVNHRFQRATVGYASLNTFRNKLRQAVLTGALALHNAFRSHLGAGQIFSALEVSFT